jgi:hypothetical protein
MSDRSTSADKSERSESTSHAHVAVALDFLQKFLSGETMLVAWSAGAAAPQAKTFSIPVELGLAKTWLEAMLRKGGSQRIRLPCRRLDPAQ